MAPCWFHIFFSTEFGSPHYAGGEFEIISMSVTYDLFQLPTVLSILSRLPIMGTTPLVKSSISFLVLFRRSDRAAFCH